MGSNSIGSISLERYENWLKKFSPGILGVQRTMVSVKGMFVLSDNKIPEVWE